MFWFSTGILYCAGAQSSSLNKERLNKNKKNQNKFKCKWNKTVYLAEYTREKKKEKTKVESLVRFNLSCIDDRHF